MANIEKIVLPDNTEYDIKDKGALQVTDISDGRMESNGWNALRVKATDSTHNPHFDLYDSTDKPVGAIWVQQSSGDFRIYGYQSNGADSSSGLYMEQGGRIVIFGHNNNIVLRPNGVDSASGQVYVSTDGVLYGGGQIFASSTSKSISAGAVTDMVSITLPQGSWLVVSWMKGNTGSTGSLYNYIESNSFGVNHLVISPATNGGASSNTGQMTVTGSGETIKSKCYSTGANTVTAQLWAIRVN